MNQRDLKIRFVLYFWFVSWQDVSFGLSFHIGSAPHIEIHLPFGFIKVGFERKSPNSLNHQEVSWREKRLI